MKIGRRGLRAVKLRLLDASNYTCVPRFFLVHRRPVRALFDEVFSSGAYPRTISLRTPTGPISIQLFSPADLSTANLLFCRQDYHMPADARVVVDIGSNIGLSSLYWLTRNKASFVHCYEPFLATYERMLVNLGPFRHRVEPHLEAVSNFSGPAKLGIEPTGVFNSLDLKNRAVGLVDCQVVHVNDVLEGAMRQHGHVDVLKVDSEGHEFRTLEAIAPEFWGHIRCVNVGCHGNSAAVPGEFHRTKVGSAERFCR
jgi:FkbM family methyltransferase